MRRTPRLFSVALMVFMISLLSAPSLLTGQQISAKHTYLVYVGTYTGPTSRGIYAYRFDAGTGKWTSLGLVAETTNPSFLTVAPSRRFLYAVNEVSDYQGQKSGSVSAFAVDRNSGKLTFLNEVSSRGAGPCHISVDKTGRYVLVANYDSGSVAVFPVMKDGRLGDASSFVQHTGHGVDQKRQEGPHAHDIGLSPDNRFAMVADLGLDELLVYRFNPANGKLVPNNLRFAKVESGAGARHFTFHPSGRFVYAVNEMQSSVTAFSYNKGGGVLHKLQTISALPKDFQGNNDAAEIEVHPSGKFVYSSNRGNDSIAVFAINSAKGTLRLVEIDFTKGRTPRSFGIDPTGSYLFAANQESNNIVLFRIDSRIGRLTPTGQVLEVPSPVCVKFVALE